MSDESTTPDLVELGHRFLEAANRHDLDAMMSLFAPGAVWETGSGMGTFEGVAAIRGLFRDWLASYEELRGEQEDRLDLGNGVVFAVVAQRGRPIGSSGEVQTRYGVVTEWVEGRIARLTNYQDIDQARAAAKRLAEERAQADV